MHKTTLSKREKSPEELSNQELIASAVKDIAMNNMQIFEVRRYSISDQLSKKLKGHSFVAHTLDEIDVINIDTKSKPGYIVLNDGSLDYPIVTLKRNEDGPWYQTNKEKALQQVKTMNEVTWEAIEEAEEEVALSKEFMRNLIENGRI